MATISAPGEVVRLPCQVYQYWERTDIGNRLTCMTRPQVMEAICVMKGVKPERKPDASGRPVDEYWGVSLKMLSDLKFLDSLKAYDKDHIPVPIIKKIRDK